MEDLNVRIHYLYNSGFAVETKSNLLIFDYYKDTPVSGKRTLLNGVVGENDLKTHKPIYVFSSHGHQDHFNPVIFKWQSINQKIKYILSSDIKVKQPAENIYFLSAYEELELDQLHIKAYGSTDLGISFFIKTDGITLFHAGDLNWWYWWDDTPAELAKAEEWFKAEIIKIKEQKIDIAFFPVDPRLEQNYAAGGKYFLKEINPKFFIPMHFGEKYETTKSFADKMVSSSTKVLTLSHRGQEIML